jgi:hypothetical protein
VLRVLAAVGASAFALLMATKAIAMQTVAIVTASPASNEAAAHLRTQIDHPVVFRATPNARFLDALMAEARDSWPEELVVVVDTERAVVSVVRPSDGTIGSRTLAPSAARAPYAVALAAVELLEIVERAPEARSAALPERQPRGLRTRLALDFGLLQSVSTNGEVGLFRPTAGVDLEFSQERNPVWVGVGVHGSGLAPMHRDQALVLPGGPDERGSIEYARNEVSLRPSIGHRQGPAAVVGWLDLGLASVRTTARDGDSNVVAVDSRAAFWLGLGGELRYTIGAGFSLGIGAGVAWLPVTSRFYASPPGTPSAVPAFVEGALELRARAAVVWEAP